MALANGAYYATRDPLGVAGDFVTAPEISQMFGELIGLWLADLWARAGRPADAIYVELGPGRGTLAADARRAMRAAGLTPAIHLVETSPVLRAAQAERLPDAVWHNDLATLPGAPLLVVANEFCDALPIRQFVREADGLRERMVDLGADGGFVALPAGGMVIESCPAAQAIVQELAHRLAGQGGAAMVIDYGYEGPAVGDTLQALRGHAPADPYADPGNADLTAHVDFAALRAAAVTEGVRSYGPTAQGSWLEALGITARAAALTRAAPARATEIAAARTRLTDPQAMGDLFKALALVAPGWPEPEGFA